MLEQNLAYFERPPRSDKIKSENRQKIDFFDVFGHKTNMV